MPVLQPCSNNLGWRVSRRCDGGACVMVGRQDEAIIVANAEQPNGTHMVYPVAAWRDFLLSIRQDAFNPPADL
jgi:hypothetical protein